MFKGFYYEQSTGAFGVQNGDFVFPLGDGYAGKAASRNVPNDDHLRGLGPLPRGEYLLTLASHQRFAEPAFRLEQVKGQKYFRNGFWVHGDNKTSTASSGCIVLGKPVRLMIKAFLDFGYDRMIVRP